MENIQHIHWAEYLVWSDKNEAGHACIYCWDGKQPLQKILPQCKVRSRIYDYGGGDVVALAGGVAYVSEEYLIWLKDGKERVIKTGKVGNLTASGSWLSGVSSDAKTAIFAIDMQSQVCHERILEPGCSAMNMQVCPDDHNQYAFIQWQDPFMPWDESQLVIGTWDHPGMQVLPNPYGNNVQQMIWLNARTLVVVAQNGDWWNLAKVDIHSNTWEILLDEPFDCAAPLWQMGKMSLGFANNGIYFTSCRQGEYVLRFYDLKSQSVKDIELPIQSVQQLAVNNNQVAVLGGGPCIPRSLYVLENGHLQRLHDRDLSMFMNDFKSLPCFTPKLLENGPVRAWLYDTQGESMVVALHGGPTGQHDPILDEKLYELLSQKISFCALDYHGSTGQGQQFRNSLYACWGERDVQDCVWLVKQLRQLYPHKKIYLKGNSAASWTCLLAASAVRVDGITMRYPVLNPYALLDIAPRFEKGYLQRLLGSSQRIDLSEIFATLKVPIIVQQGLADPVVPADTTRQAVEALRANGVDVIYYEFDGQGHGFKDPEVARRAFQNELDFMERLGS
jgi:dienelactone hydrolase